MLHLSRASLPKNSAIPLTSRKRISSPAFSDFQNLYLGQRLDVLGIKAAPVNTGNLSSAIARACLVVATCVRRTCLFTHVYSTRDSTRAGDLNSTNIVHVKNVLLHMCTSNVIVYAQVI